MDKALLIIDMLHDFVRPGGKLYFEKAGTIVEAIQGIRDNFKAAGLPVFYDNDAHPEDSEEFHIWPPHCVKGSRGAQVVDELAPEPGDYIMEKDSLSAFDNPDLEPTLRELGVTELYLTGTATEYCVYEAAMAALEHGFRVFIIVDAVAGVDRSMGDISRAVRTMKQAGAEFISAQEAMERAGRCPLAMA